jgi:hypothetical protein
MAEWQTIETAPKNKSVLIASGDLIRIAIHTRAWSDMTRGYSEKWWIAQNLPFDHPGPTHWMPLPAPPETR